MQRFLKFPRPIEAAILVTCISVALALLLQPAQWASDGDISLPVKIFVFDAVHCRPIANAECLIFRAAPVIDEQTLAKHPPSDFPINEAPEESRAVTDASGFSVIKQKFGTSANHNNPAPRAHLMNYWIRVEATGFGGVVVPVGYDERLTSVMRKDGQILISIGLLPVKEPRL